MYLVHEFIQEWLIKSEYVSGAIWCLSNLECFKICKNSKEKCKNYLQLYIHSDFFFPCAEAYMSKLDLKFVKDHLAHEVLLIIGPK